MSSTAAPPGQTSTQTSANTTTVPPPQVTTPTSGGTSVAEVASIGIFFLGLLLQISFN